MAKALKSILGAAAVLIGVTVLAFALSVLSPTDSATRYFTDNGIVPTAEQIDAKRAELGIDRPIPLQYLGWLGAALSGDLGESYRTGAPVTAMLFDALPYTLALTATAMALTLIIAVPLGILCATHRNSPLDYFIRGLTFLFNALPMFFVALLLLFTLASQLHLFNVIASRDVSGLVMPTLALALPLSAWYIRQVRAAAIGELSQPYVAGLQARGIPESRIIWRHVLRNMAVPLLSLTGISIGSLLGGTAIVESIFSWPGVGYLSIVAIGARDYPVIVGYALTLGIIYLIVNGLIDALCRCIDPRSAESEGRR
ncbi:ABC transporter permease [Adlercreutzia sp. R25]|uniref:ABC transporter permease n=1 Tax=Adlercreutzia shanghongiae TaxID=3111773 RepID=UPI002DB9539D|nr:ABC transporter permease [Adlercreutzia sp. R25]MEC4271899.1 ABC transporter permease [Adlercreutzia sp. R25]